MRLVTGLDYDGRRAGVGSAENDQKNRGHAETTYRPDVESNSADSDVQQQRRRGELDNTQPKGKKYCCPV